MLIRAGAPRGARRRCAPPSKAEQLALFAFVNDEGHWAQFCASAAAAGFETPVRLSDDEADPYETITRLGMGTGYAILCHQDVRFDQGMGERELRERLEELTSLDPCWTVAGNAGVTPDGHVVWGPQDRSGWPAASECPAEVVSLDENFLILNCDRSPRCSDGLSGFHFYGTDVCLNAIRDGGSAYVVDLRMTHLSLKGTRDASFDEARARLLEAWNGRCWFRYVGTTTTILFLSRFRPLRRVFGSSRALSWVDLLREPG